MLRARAIPRLVLIATLVAVPAIAQPPYAPSDQYASFDRDSTTIFDTKTLLRWERDVPLSPMSYADADAYCKGRLGGEGRLPTIKELLTIFSEEPYQSYEGATLVVRYLDRDAFPATKTPVRAPYWTSTPVRDDPNGGPFWALSFATGEMSQTPKDGPTLNTRCVKYEPRL